MSEFTSVSHVDDGSVPLHACTHGQCGINAAGAQSMHTSAYGANAGGHLPHFHVFEPKLITMVTGPFGSCRLADVIVMTRD